MRGLYNEDVDATKTMAVLESAIFWIIVAAVSEIIALSPLKDNSIVEVVLHALDAIKKTKAK